uniref:CD164 antigen n=1 Tax=Mus musculus TaxID=10090 RepID=A0A1L1SSS8_MOUSE
MRQKKPVRASTAVFPVLMPPLLIILPAFGYIAKKQIRPIVQMNH